MALNGQDKPAESVGLRLVERAAERNAAEAAPSVAPDLGSDPLAEASAPAAFSRPLAEAKAAWGTVNFHPGSDPALSSGIGAEILERGVFGAIRNAAASKIMASDVAITVMLPPSMREPIDAIFKLANSHIVAATDNANDGRETSLKLPRSVREAGTLAA